VSLIDIRRRDGLARTGQFEHEGKKRPFPAALPMEEEFPSLLQRAYSCVPLMMDAAFAQAYHQEGNEEPLPLHPHVPSSIPHGSCVLVPGWHTALAHPADYVDWIVGLKERVPSDTLWYAPAAARPDNVALLLYSGFDLFDFTGVDLVSAQNRFCTTEGTFPGDWMDRGICHCDGCREKDLHLHNRNALLGELALGSQFIIRGFPAGAG
jgi:hypothetical protein